MENKDERQKMIMESEMVKRVIKRVGIEITVQGGKKMFEACRKRGDGVNIWKRRQ